MLNLIVYIQEEIRESYVQGTMDQQWSRIKVWNQVLYTMKINNVIAFADFLQAYVIDEVTKERGIQFGIKKWQHSASQQ